jgi:hypothetical protein
MLLRTLRVIASIGLLATVIRAQGITTPAPQAAGSAAISGTVTDAATGRPLAGVIVSLRPPIAAPNQPMIKLVRQLTDERGRFVFRDLPAAEGYTLSTVYLGYVDGAFGQSVLLGPNGKITLANEQWFANADIAMWKPGAIGGRVVDEFGEPMVGVYVRALARLLIAGRPQFVAGPVGLTDDRGEYRIPNLPPGSYVVQVPSVQAAVPADAPRDTLGTTVDPATTRPFMSLVAPRPRTDAALDAGGSSRLVIGNYATPPAPVDGRAQAYPMTFFPSGSAHTNAETISIGVGEDRRGVDIAMRPVPTARIFGMVQAPPEVLVGLVLRLMPAGLEDLSTGGESATALVGADGAFAFLNVPAGSYVIDAPRTTLELTYQTGPSSYALPQTPGVRLGGASSGSVVAGPSGLGSIRRSGQGEDLYWTRTPITVGNADVQNLMVTMNKSLTLAGRLVYEGTTRTTIESVPIATGGARPPVPAQVVQPPPPKPDRTPTIYAEPADGSPSLGLPRSMPNSDSAGAASDAFRLEGIKGGEYVIRVPFGLDRYTVQKITVGGVDYTDRPIDGALLNGRGEVIITLTDKMTSVRGVVRDETGVTGSAAVIVFPVERDQWTRYGFTPRRIQGSPVAGKAGYSIGGLPAGDYFIVAVDTSLVTAWQDPKFLERAAALATRLSLAWDESKTLDLTKVRIR